MNLTKQFFKYVSQNIFGLLPDFPLTNRFYRVYTDTLF